MITILEHLFRHNRWANRRILEACRGLSPDQLATEVEGTYGSLDATLLHLVRAEVGYVHRLTGEPRLLAREAPNPGLDRLLELLDRTGTTLEEVAAGLDPSRIIEIVTEEGNLSVPAFVVLLQAINHATDHRSQVATILTQLGVTPPEVDLWSYDEAGLSRA
jgi:uncharacterized damage-inducible protein DinB